MTICYARCFHSSSVLQSVPRSSSDTLPGCIALSLRSAGHHKPPWTNRTGTRRFPRCSRVSLKKRMDPRQLDLGDISCVLLNTHLSHGRASSAPPERGSSVWTRLLISAFLAAGVATHWASGIWPKGDDANSAPETAVDNET